jgi:hypothetical protein
MQAYGDERARAHIWMVRNISALANKQRSNCLESCLQFCASRKNNVLIIKEGLEPEALDEISLKMDKIMGISQKELILTHHRPKFRMNEILCIKENFDHQGGSGT